MQRPGPVASGKTVVFPTVSATVPPSNDLRPVPEVPLGPGSGAQAKAHPAGPGFFGTVFGALRPAVAGVVLAAVIAGSAVAQTGGAPLPSAPRVDGHVAAALDGPRANFEPPEGNPTLDLDRYQRELDVLLRAGRITVSELSTARDLLRRALIDREPNLILPRDYRGRVDLVALATLGIHADAMSRGERVFSNMRRELDLAMRVTARDMADPNTVLIEGAPGYKEIPPDQVRRIVERAIKNVPLGELPGGDAVARLVEALPQMAGTNARTMSINELTERLGDRYQDWANARLLPLIEGHEVEAGVLAFAAITGLRAGSPAVAHFMDRMGVKFRVYSVSTNEAGLYSRGRLVYRDGNVLPDLDIEGGARHVVGNTTLRATVTSTLSAESEHHLRTAATLGARYDQGRYWLDSAVTYLYPQDRVETAIRGGYLGDSLMVSGLLAGTYGRGVAVGDASGRLNLELDVTKDLNLGNGVRGDWGVFVGGAADSDFDNRDLRAGLVFRLRW